MKGYWNKPEESEWSLRGGWQHTGDICKLDEEGYLYYVDRLKDMIKSGAENVYSKEVEDVLYTHPARNRPVGEKKKMAVGIGNRLQQELSFHPKNG